MSGPMTYAPSLDERMDDIRAVMDAAGSERAALLGYSAGAALALMFVATHGFHRSGRTDRKGACCAALLSAGSETGIASGARAGD